MKDDTVGGGAAESSAGQHLVKLIGNLCFSLFVVSVLVVTVIAITYQPPDPWFQSSAALTVSLSSVIPNATFKTDESVLQTGEDLIPLPPTPSPAATPPPPPPPISPSEAAAPCDLDAPINCSDPRAVDAIRRFNAKIFQSSIVFFGYGNPVPAPHAGECDVSWRFRNRREKSWRRYRDYRRFHLAINGDNCTYQVLSAGKFRSGTNAVKSPPPSKRITPSSAPKISEDVEINDTIPTVGSESEFRKGKYLYYSRGGDYCKGMNHYLWSLLCGLAEARFLNRTFVMDLSICLASTYNPSGRDEEGKDFRHYFDYEHLKESVSVVEEDEFLRDWRRWEHASQKNTRITSRKIPTFKVTPMQLRKDRSMILWRQFDGPEPENYWYRVCEGRAAKNLQRPWKAIWKSKHLMNIVSEIAGTMDWDYDAIHVVRGEKAANKDLWPNLDRDTSPDSLVEKVTKIVQPWRNLYIATNEPFYHYFDKLRSHYKVHLLDDYQEMWGNKSEWYNMTATLNGGRPVVFDGYMRVAVDTEVLYRAKTRVETFNNLTRDCKDGINTC